MIDSNTKAYRNGKSNNKFDHKENIFETRSNRQQRSEFPIKGSQTFASPPEFRRTFQYTRTFHADTGKQGKKRGPEKIENNEEGRNKIKRTPTGDFRRKRAINFYLLPPQ